jgi:hypothetical protein
MQRENKDCLQILTHYGKGEGHSALCMTLSAPLGRVFAAPSGSGIMARQWACGYSLEIPFAEKKKK